MHDDFGQLADSCNLTRDGRLKVWFEKEEGVGEGTQGEKTIWRVAGGWGTVVATSSELLKSGQPAPTATAAIINPAKIRRPCRSIGLLH